MTGWLFLSDREAPVQAGRGAALTGMLPQATLVIELSWPLPTGVLLDWSDGAGNAFSLFHHAQGGLALLWRQGSLLRRFLLPGALTVAGRIARLLFRWDKAAGAWAMRLDDGDAAMAGSTGGLNPPEIPAALLAGLCGGNGLRRRDGAVLWYGVALGPVPPRGLAWIAPSTPVPTVEGDVPAGLLRPGQWILTEDAGPRRLRAAHRMELPCRGSHAPVVLRAPWFGRGQDLLVSSDQLVVVGGLEAEYLFGEEQVLVGAGALVDGRAAQADNRRATVQGIALDLGGLHLIDAGGCRLMTAHPGPPATRPLPPLRVLHDYEALPLMGLLRRLKSSDAA